MSIVGKSCLNAPKVTSEVEPREKESDMSSFLSSSKLAIVTSENRFELP